MVLESCRPSWWSSNSQAGVLLWDLETVVSFLPIWVNKLSWSSFEDTLDFIVGEEGIMHMYVSSTKSLQRKWLLIFWHTRLVKKCGQISLFSKVGFFSNSDFSWICVWAFFYVKNCTKIDLFYLKPSLTRKWYHFL